ncbi:alpha/beta-hydrolase [Tothia fuscella]|uniref:Alpha/beta-hydrolase n=1 Tax=Tothia fuscella TaxID=1048955 RepID=A0A9P4P1K7_9PEZI|nr:alpha/beta-hydrolase [Tothia fuscella]
MASISTKYIGLPTGETVFYREAGSPSSPTILLLHGFPSSSHQYRNLISLLAPKYHLLAPDLPGFGFTTTPEDYVYSFDNIAETISTWLETMPNGPAKYSIYIFDYGAPTGLRLALKKPSAITAIISQNGNAYEEGLGEFWAPIRKYWSSHSAADREALGFLVKPETTKMQYTLGTADQHSIAPETYTLDQALMDRPGNADIQLDLLYDYRTNLPLYPKFQEYFRNSQVPLLAVWGQHDIIFVQPGAEAFKKDLPEAQVSFLNAGHFAVETNTDEIAKLMVEFFQKIGL